jgi:ABC-type transporter Mla subunit MlaD
MRRGRSRGLSPFAAGLLAIVLIALGTYVGFTKANPFASHFEIQAAFRTSADLKTKSPVRISGIDIGTVSKIEPIGQGEPGSLVTMRINDSGRPLRTDATAKVRPRIFLEGNYFVDLQPGSPSAPEMKEGGTIPATNTAAPVGFGQLLETLQSDTREDLRIVLQEYGRGLALKGGDGYNRSIRHQLPAFRDSAIVNDATLGLEENDLSEYLYEFGSVAEGLDRDPEQLKALITDFAATADAFALEERNLSATIDQLPDTLRVGRSALGELNEALPPLRRFARAMTPAVRSSGPALDATLPFVRQMRGLVSRPELRGLVADLRPTVPELAKLNRGGVALQEQQRLLSSCQNNVILPWQEDTVPDPFIPAKGKVYQEGVKWFPGIAGESRSFDANGQYIRTVAAGANFANFIGDRIFLTGRPLQAVNPPKKSDPPLRTDVPCETQQPPDLRTNAQAPPRSVRIDNSSPAARALEAKGQEAAEEWLRNQVKVEGLADELKVTSERLTVQDMPLLRRVFGNRGGG